MTLDDVLLMLKGLRRFDTYEVHTGCDCCGGWTEREYSDSGEFINASSVEEIIKAIEADDVD